MKKEIWSIFIRYIILVLVAIPNLYIFYLIFTPLTIYPVFFLLNLFFEASLNGSTIFFNQISIQIIKACVAGSAYYLLLILNLSTPKIKPTKRIKMILLAFASLLILNILRIFLLSIFLVSNFSLFNIVHKIFWYLVSIIFVVAIWFAQARLFKIKEIPFYSDLKFLYNLKNAD